jgi:protein SCO1
VKKTIVLILLAFAAAQLAPIGAAYAQEGELDPLLDVGFDQKLNAQIPLELIFVDDHGEQVRLAQYFGRGKPVVLVLAYYECPMLCTLVLNDLTEALQGLGFVPGIEFEIVTVSIAPEETYQLAAEKKALHIAEYGNPEGAAGWHFLTGDQPEIDRLADAVGFRYVYIPETEEYSHAAGIMVLTPQGRISRYFFGFEYSSQELRMGLIEASEEKIGSPIDSFFLLCYAYDPVTGRYSLLIHNVLRLAGSGTALIVIAVVLLFVWRERQKPPKTVVGSQ